MVDTVISVTPGLDEYSLAAPVVIGSADEQFLVSLTAFDGDVELFHEWFQTQAAVTAFFAVLKAHNIFPMESHGSIGRAGWQFCLFDPDDRNVYVDVMLLDAPPEGCWYDMVAKARDDRWREIDLGAEVSQLLDRPSVAHYVDSRFRGVRRLFRILSSV